MFGAPWRARATAPGPNYPFITHDLSYQAFLLLRLGFDWSDKDQQSESVRFRWLFDDHSETTEGAD